MHIQHLLKVSVESKGFQKLTAINGCTALYK